MTKYKDLHEDAKSHAASDLHKAAKSAASNFRAVTKDPTKDIVCTINTGVIRIVELNIGLKVKLRVHKFRHATRPHMIYNAKQC